MHNKKIAQTALANVITLSTLNTIQPALAATNHQYVKCYGIAAAGKNDCATTNASCAGTIKKTKACYAWIYVPKGVCGKIAGASAGKPAAGCKEK